MNNATTDSPNTSTHRFIIFLVFFPAGDFINRRNPPPIPKPAETGSGILLSKPWVHDARMWKLNADVLEKPKLALRFLKVYLFFQTQMWPPQCCF